MAAEINETWMLLAQQALADLNSDFCYFLDHGKIQELVNLFTEDALYTHGKRVSRGRNEILKLFEKRGGRTSRHLQTGLRLQVLDDIHARGRSVCLTFGADAPPPVTPAEPYLVADFDDEYVRGEDGVWRIKRRHIERIFTAPGNRGPEGMKKDSELLSS